MSTKDTLLGHGRACNTTVSFTYLFKNSSYCSNNLFIWHVYVEDTFWQEQIVIVMIHQQNVFSLAVVETPHITSFALKYRVVNRGTQEWGILSPHFSVLIISFKQFHTP